jgi:hypothetical protein
MRPEDTVSPPTSTVTIPSHVTVAEGADPFYADLARCVADSSRTDFGELDVHRDGSPTDAGQSSLDEAVTAAPDALARCHEVLGSHGAVRREAVRLFPGSISIPEVTVSMLVPESWESTVDDLTPIVTGPQEAISLATFSMRSGGEECAHVPVNALEDMAPDDVFIQILNGTGSEELPPTFAGRVDQLPQGEHIECLASPEREDIGSLLWAPFTENGHGLYILVALGAEVTREQLHLAERVLDSIEIIE